MQKIDKQEIAMLGGGCFWCLEAAFQRLNGVIKVVSGYSGGKTENLLYDQVCSGITGHAEVVRITFNPEIISFKQILEVFFAIHDPTTLNRQGADVGTQYRSAIFYHSEEQKEIAEQVIKELTNERIFGKPIVTEITPFTQFYPAEDYHQDYYTSNSQQPYCRFVIDPKLAKLRQKFSSNLK